MSHSSSQSGANRNSKGYLVLAASLGAILMILFFRSFIPHQALFSNDGPLGVQMAEPYRMPGSFFGMWNDLFWLGSDSGSFLPNIYGTSLLIFGPKGYTNFHVLIGLMILGLCAACFFRQLGFKPLVCILGGLAAALNGNFFSNACWGLSSRATSLGMTFLALAAIESGLKSRPILKSILAGLAIGMSICEAGDNGAIFSLFVASYASFRTVFRDGPVGQKLAKAVGKVAVMAVFAALLAAQTLNIFVGTAVKGIAGMEQQAQSKEVRWGWATQWSLPKMEMLRVVIPGLYGYLVNSPDGAEYWGWVGETPGWEENHNDPQWVQTHGNLPRHSGAGEYGGVLVVLVALWGLAWSKRNSGNTYSESERKQIWFWGLMALMAMLLAWGRWAPFYQFVYALPYFSTIRNPMKFMHPFHMALMILFAYGLQGLSRRYLEVAAAKTNSLTDALKSWWAKAQGLEKLWTWGCLGAVALSVLAFLIYSSARGSLAHHLEGVGFDQQMSAQIAKFSAGEVGWFVVFLAASVGALILVQSGAFAGRRAKWAGIILGIVLCIDLARANAPWIQYFDYTDKYATSQVIDILREKPFEGRVTAPTFLASTGNGQFPSSYSRLFGSYYGTEWLQHHFQYYNIQALDVAQEPRMPADKEAFVNAVGRDLPHMGRYWQLTNTRYLLGLSGYLDVLNSQFDPGQSRFRIRATFDLAPKPGVQVTKLEDFNAVPMTNGPIALFEFTGALPRAKLFTQWQVMTNDQATLAKLADPAFDPGQAVLVAPDSAAPATNLSTNPAPASAIIASYAPRKVEVKTDSAAPGVLLLNDRYHPDWKVEVDGKPAALLRCNFIMRGVSLAAGQHIVTFNYEPKHTMFFTTLAAVSFGLLLCGYLAVSKSPPVEAPAPSAPKPSPAPARKS